jgi:hypothetical protein
MAHERSRTQIQLAFYRIHNLIPREGRTAVEGVEVVSPLATEPEGSRQPLTTKQQVALDIIREQPPGEPIIGKKIIAEAKRRRITISSENTLTSHIIPVLKKYHGVKNDDYGYYCTSLKA